ncbi:MFS transporter [Puniceibacterium sp. IMCC21224]|uniref:MFS transporter n=1 Tax=Puniceibacterium sp. IMCC21224 TaxID=1618204 RepID=UPI00064DF859|nr:MFS transporter [Puniceibacterium sp. IMCC21224]KMK63932.1 arabinose efflux permease family protein [Puniceibacterium sp. IMCC21224]
MSATTSAQPRQNWTVVIFGFLALSLAFSSRAALGLIMPVWQTEFGWTSSYISSVGAAALLIMAIVAPFAGRLVDRLGSQFTLNLGMGLLGVGCAIVALMNGKLMFVIGFAGFCAIGFGIVATHVVATAVARSFSDNQGLATGIGTSGATGGQFLIVPLIAALLAFASWRWSFGALSLASLALIPCIRMSMRPDMSSNEAEGRKDDPSTMRQDFTSIVRQPAFHLLFWSFLICGFTTTGVVETHLLPFAAFCGFPPIPSATAYGLLSLVNLIGMIAAGWLTDRVNRPMLLAAIYMLRALTFILLGSIPGTSIEMLFLFAVLFGAVDYSTVPVTASFVASHVGIKTMGLAMGLISAGHALGGAMGAFAGGYVFTATQTYTLVWTGSVWLAVGAGVLALFLKAHPITKAAAS